MPRNKTKALRNAIGAGETAAKTVAGQLRGVTLPQKPDVKLPADVSGFAPYFDILEFYDVYENLLNREGPDHA
jgi:hypothetical protein